MQDLKQLFDKKHSFAVIGASSNMEKYGAKIYKRLKDLGIEVYPVNVKSDEVQGDEAYQTVADLPKKVDVLDFVMPPKASKQVTQEALKSGYKTFWYQPGSFDQELIDLHKGLDTWVINNACVLIETESMV